MKSKILSLPLVALLAACSSNPSKIDPITMIDDSIIMSPVNIDGDDSIKKDVTMGLTKDAKGLWLNIAVSSITTPLMLTADVDGVIDNLDANPNRVSFEIKGKDQDWSYMTIALPSTVLDSWIDATNIKLTVKTDGTDIVREISPTDNEEFLRIAKIFRKKSI